MKEIGVVKVQPLPPAGLNTGIETVNLHSPQAI
jgi:hypothetical protein